MFRRNFGKSLSVGISGGDGRTQEPEIHELAPIGVASTLIHGIKDKVVPIDQSDRYAAAAIAAGDIVDEQRLKGVDHFAPIDPRMRAWATCRIAALGYLV